MLTGYERTKVRKATLTFPVLLLLRLLMRGWANNQFSELIAAFPRRPIGLSKKLYSSPTNNIPHFLKFLALLTRENHAR